MDIEESKRCLIGHALDNLRSAGCTTAEIAEVIFEKLRARTEARDLAMGIPELLDEGR